MSRARPWRARFQEAFHGIWLGSHEEPSCRVHLIATLIVVAMAISLGCDYLEWCLLIGCIGAVWTAELMNSAVEQLFKGFPVEVRNQFFPCLHIAAGAVLLASITAALIGGVIFARKILVVTGVFPA